VKVNSRVRLQFRIQSGIFLLLFVGLLVALAWLSNRYPLTIDMSANQRNSLSQESQRLIESIELPLQLTLFVSPINQSKPLLEALFERYQQRQPNINFQSLNPDLYPDLLRTHDIRYDGEVLLEYQGRSANATPIAKPTMITACLRRNWRARGTASKI
jgi:ABC-type uncharacterized transport system involved in gliding motility auxiliary subunit